MDEDKDGLSGNDNNNQLSQLHGNGNESNDIAEDNDDLLLEEEGDDEDLMQEGEEEEETTTAATVPRHNNHIPPHDDTVDEIHDSSSEVQGERLQEEGDEEEEEEGEDVGDILAESFMSSSQQQQQQQQSSHHHTAFAFASATAVAHSTSLITAQTSSMFGVPSTPTPTKTTTLGVGGGAGILSSPPAAAGATTPSNEMHVGSTVATAAHATLHSFSTPSHVDKPQHHHLQSQSPHLPPPSPLASFKSSSVTPLPAAASATSTIPTPRGIMNASATPNTAAVAPTTSSSSNTDYKLLWEREKADRQRLEIEFEQQAHALSRQTRNLQTQLQTTSSKLATTTTSLTALQATHAQLQTTHADLERRMDGGEGAAAVLRAQVETVEQEKKGVLSVLERRNEEMDLIRAELDHTKQSLSSHRSQIAQLTTAKEDWDGIRMTLTHQLDSNKLELEQVRKQNDWLREELETRASEVRKIRVDKTEQVSALQAQVDELTSDRNQLQTRCTALVKRSDEIEEKYQAAMTKIKEAEDASIQSQLVFKQEMTSLKRLSDLYHSQATDLTTRNNELEALLTDLQRGAAARDAEALEAKEAAQRAREALHEVEGVRDAANEKVIELEARLKEVTTGQGGLDAGIEALGTLSASAAAASKLQKSGKSLTEVYSEYSAVKSELLKEKAEVNRLTQLMNQIIDDIQEKAPVFNQQKQDLDHALQEVGRLTAELTGCIGERDVAKSTVESLAKQCEGLALENKVFGQETRDLGRQVQALLSELETARGGPAAANMFGGLVASSSSLSLASEETQADAIISERLVIFRNIQDLQTQNQQLRRSLRTLSKRFEEMERDRDARMEEESIRQVGEAKKLIEELREQLRLQMLKVETFTRERDQWRRIAEGRGVVGISAPATSATDGIGGSAAVAISPPRVVGSSSGAVAAGGSKSSSSRPVTPSNDLSTSTANGTSLQYQSLYREVQTDFDAFRREVGIDTRMLKQQIDELKEEKSQLNIQLAKLNTQLDYQQERYQLLLTNTEMQRAECTQLRERIATISQNLVRQDVKIEELTNDLLEANHTQEQSKNEVRHLRSELTVVKVGEERLVSENKSLVQERVRSQEMLRDSQRLFDDLDRASKEEKKRLDDRIERLEKDLQVARKQLNDQIEENRTLSLRKDIDLKELQSKIDRLTADSQKAKEDVLVSRTNQENLTIKCADLQSRLTVAEDKLNVYTTAAASRPTTASAGGAQVSSDEKIKELELRIIRMRTEHQAIQDQLRLEKERVETFQAISQSSEEQLQSLTEAYDTYKADMDRRIEDQQVKVSELEKSNEDLKESLNKSYKDFSELQEKSNLEKTFWERDKKALEDQINHLKQREEELVLEQSRNHEEVKRQAGIAQEARQNYERELQQHSKSIESISKLKEDLVAWKDSSANYRQQARTSESKLQSELSSWTTIKTRLSEEMEQLKQRIQDLDEQNRLLHSQLEQVTSQALKIQERSTSSSDDLTLDQQDLTSQKIIDDLRQLIKILRRDKDIAETSHDITKQERDRIKLQTEHIQRSLDETRVLLDEERKRNQDALGSEQKHAELMEKINQLNILRESNASLRLQSEDRSKKVVQLEQSLKTTQSQLLPLQEQISNLNAELEASKSEIKALEEDNDRWKGRTQQILAKYERIDPVEHQRLKDQVNSFTLEKVQLEKEREELVKELDGLKKSSHDSLKEAISLKDAEIQESKNKIEETTKALEESMGERTRIANRFNDLAKKFQLSTKELKELNEKVRSIQEEKDKAVAAAADAAAAATTAPAAPPPELTQELRKQIESELTMKFKVRETMTESQIKRLRAQNEELERRLSSTASNSSTGLATSMLPPTTKPVATAISTVTSMDSTPTPSSSFTTAATAIALQEAAQVTPAPPSTTATPIPPTSSTVIPAVVSSVSSSTAAASIKDQFRAQVHAMASTSTITTTTTASSVATSSTTSDVKPPLHPSTPTPTKRSREESIAEETGLGAAVAVGAVVAGAATSSKAASESSLASESNSAVSLAGSENQNAKRIRLESESKPSAQGNASMDTDNAQFAKEAAETLVPKSLVTSVTTSTASEDSVAAASSLDIRMTIASTLSTPVVNNVTTGLVVSETMTATKAIAIAPTAAPISTATPVTIPVLATPTSAKPPSSATTPAAAAPTPSDAASILRNRLLMMRPAASSTPVNATTSEPAVATPAKAPSPISPPAPASTTTTSTTTTATAVAATVQPDTTTPSPTVGAPGGPVTRGRGRGLVMGRGAATLLGRGGMTSRPSSQPSTPVDTTPSAEPVRRPTITPIMPPVAPPAAQTDAATGDTSVATAAANTPATTATRGRGGTTLVRRARGAMYRGGAPQNRGRGRGRGTPPQTPN